MNFQKQKKKAKFDSIRRRKNELCTWLDFYNGEQEYYLKQNIEQTYDDNDNKNLLKKRIAIKNITKSIVNKTSLVFQNGYDAYISGDDEKTKLLRNKLRDYNFDELLPTLNRQTNLLFDEHINTTWNEEERSVVFELIQPQITFVWENERFPQNADMIAYIVNEQPNTPNGNKVNVVNVWTKYENYLAELNDDGTLEVYKNTIVPNIFGYIPLVHFSNSYRTDGYFSNEENTLVKENLRLNAMWTELMAGYSLQTLSTLVLSGKLPEGVVVSGLSHFISLSGDSKIVTDEGIQDAKYINPNTPLDKMVEVLEKYENNIANNNGLNSDVYRNNSTATSGYQLKLQKQELMNKTKEDIPMYETRLKKVIKTMMLVENNNSGELAVWTDDDINNLVFNINQPSIDLSPDEALSILEKKINMGITSAIAWMMDEYGIDRETAEKRVIEYQKDNEMVKPVVDNNNNNIVNI